MSVPKASSQTSAKIIRFAFSHASSPDSKLLRTIAIRINSTGLKRLSKNKSIQFFNQYSTSSASSQNNVQPSPRTLSIRQFSTTSLQKSDTSPTLLSTDEYHKLSDTYIDSLVSKLEAMQEEREDIDVEYSAGVLTLLFPPAGTYVLNKQPPNKQIWLSSPVSGPKRYDWVASKTGGGEAPEEEGKEGEWVYLRDGSTLSGLLEEEVGVVPGVGEDEE